MKLLCKHTVDTGCYVMSAGGGVVKPWTSGDEKDIIGISDSYAKEGDFAFVYLYGCNFDTIPRFYVGGCPKCKELK